MRAMSESRTRVDLLTDQQDIAEVAKFAAKFGYNLSMGLSTESGLYGSVMTRNEETFLRDDLAHLVYLVAMTDRISVEEVLTTIRERLSGYHHVQLDVPPGDQAGLGELHPDGHN
jgi:hypothetical protein